MSPATTTNGATNGTNGTNGVNGHAQRLRFEDYYNVINNELTTTSKTRHNINPATTEPNAEVPVSTQEDVDRAVAAARAAFKPWSQIPVEQRGQKLRDYADAIDSYTDEFAKLLTAEQGKPVAQSIQEIGMATTWLRAFSTMKLPEDIIEDNEDRQVIVRYTPLGVACGIVPWNYPILLMIGKVAPALCTGNTIIIKPSPYTPYCDLKLAELGMQIFPPGVLQALSGEEDLGPMFTTHPDIDKIAFTGSSATGKKVMAASASTLKRVTLELGGNDPAILCDDVDIEAIIPKLAIVSFLCTSQICMMIKRLYVHSKIYPKFVEAFCNHVKANFKVGPGTDPANFIGPVQNSMQYEKVKDMYSQIAKQGWKPALGGDMPDESTSKGYFFNPTVIDNPPEDSRIVTEEPFGPILPILRWDDDDDVIARANDTKMGLGASVWSSNLERATRMAKQLEAGSVWVNSHFEVAPGIPFGGHKWSGIGTEWGVDGLKAYCNSQSLWLKKKL
ncbi:MAG: hypothetical protein LQ338_002263 [Usnochroma carphineum]|nr:MAG: hypothetical protein LQ338_002263 [Usnochroma carphineum]